MNKIKKIIASSALVLFANSSWATEAEEQTLLNNLAYGQLIELNQYSPGQPKGLILRLSPLRPTMKPVTWKQVSLAKNKHLITLATFDELPEVHVHPLQTKGEFVKADWAINESSQATPDRAELVLTFRELNRFVTRANSKLLKKFFHVHLNITQQGIEEDFLGTLCQRKLPDKNQCN